MRLHEYMRKQQSDRNVNAYECNYETAWGHGRCAKVPNTNVCTLFSLILVRFNLSLISLHLSQLVIYYFPSILVGCMHQRNIRSLHDAVSCDVTLVHHPPSCIRHTKFFFLIVTVLPLFPTAFFFLPSLSSKYISDMLPITEDIMRLGK